MAVSTAVTQLAAACDKAAGGPVCSGSPSLRSAATLEASSWSSQMGSRSNGCSPRWPAAQPGADAVLDRAWLVYSSSHEPLAPSTASPRSEHTARSFDSRSSRGGEWRHLQQRLQLELSGGSQHGGNGLAAELAQDEQWLLQSSPISYGSSSDCLADVLDLTLQQYAGGAGASICSGGLAWPHSNSGQPTPCNGSQALACSMGMPDTMSLRHTLEAGPLPQQQQHQEECWGSGSSQCGDAGGGTSVDWQQLLEQWAMPSSAAIAPPPLEALLAEEDAPLQLLQPQQQQQQQLGPLQPSQPLSRQASAAAPPVESVAAAPPTLQPPIAAAAPQPPAAFRRRLRSARSHARSPPLLTSAISPAVSGLQQCLSSSASPQCAPAASAAAAPAPVPAQLAIPGVPAAPSNHGAAMLAIPPPQRQQPQQQAQQGPSAQQQPAPQQSFPHPGQRKRGRPRVYDTITPVLEAARAAPDQQRQPSGGEALGGKKRRGAKPKYVCATQEEAIAKRRDRNRQTALATYYRRKARLEELQEQLAALQAEHAALTTLAETAEASEECARYIQPLLDEGCDPSAILALLLPDGDPADL